MPSFQTVSNPLRTQAGNSAAGEFPLNVTTSGNQISSVQRQHRHLHLQKPDKDVPAKAPAGSKEDASVDNSGATIATVSVSAVLIAAISLKL
ncbi:hypothetical protein OIU84_010842 [Salix udensis]|uniref:Uncharacterized protein n=1 Tax=Salix udensis TaxID=889485 RepID=A0AAD6NWC0_9ROSI|nr:hypothetical protein OIU84_010842 [Salix udensis]